MKFIAAGLSDVGLQRQHNEDSYTVLPEHALLLVADGMGGHRAGDVASQMTAMCVSEFFRKAIGSDLTWPFSFDPTMSVDENKLVTAIKLANQQILAASMQYQEVRGMGTTVVSILLSPNRQIAYVAHVGDSRAYRVRGEEIEPLTRDHSLLNDYLLIMPHLSEEQREQVPSNVITRALGLQEVVAVDLSKIQVQPGDKFLLCSDGLTGMLTDQEILATMQKYDRDVESCASELVTLANENGGEDNITVVIAEVIEA